MGHLLSPRAFGTLLLCALGLVACGHKEPDFPPPADLRLDPTERILRDRAAFAAAKANPAAHEVTLELSRVDGWLAKAEALANSNDNPKLRDLLLDTAEGQLAAIKSHYALDRAPKLPDDQPNPDDESSSSPLALPSEGSP